MLRIDVDGGVWLKPGAAIAYRGMIAFDRLPTLAARSVHDATFRELSPIVRATGKGRMYCGHRGEHVRILQLRDETMFVAWEELLAFEESLAFEAGVVGHGITAMSGGMVRMRLSGSGAVALITHGEPLTLAVTPGDPVSTDPRATIAWSGDLAPTLKTDLSWRSIVGHGGQQPIQMYFAGEGHVVVQPFKDPPRVAAQKKSLEHLQTLLAV
jgi:uncharacterized protein (AIM24 family)